MRKGIDRSFTNRNGRPNKRPLSLWDRTVNEEATVPDIEPLMTPDQIDARSRNDFFRRALTILNESNIPVMVGGAYALERYTGVARQTKDIDVFVKPSDVRRALELLAAEGFGTELTDPMWLAKAFHEGFLMDIIFSSGNRISTVDDLWIEFAPEDEVLGVEVKLCPAEEILWSKMFIMERERYDGADVAHIILRCGKNLDWDRLLMRVGEYWEVLLVHVILFDFVYPGDRDAIPDYVRSELQSRLERKNAQTDDVERLCRGPLLSRIQYHIDLKQWGYRDARVLSPHAEAA
jgi:hypothetical protein